MVNVATNHRWRNLRVGGTCEFIDAGGVFSGITTARPAVSACADRGFQVRENLPMLGVRAS